MKPKYPFSGILGNPECYISKLYLTKLQGFKLTDHHSTIPIGIAIDAGSIKWFCSDRVSWWVAVLDKRTLLKREMEVCPRFNEFPCKGIRNKAQGGA